MSTDITTVRTE